MNSNLGKKHRCHHCDGLFYDLNKQPITCPKCHHVQFEHSAKTYPSLAPSEEFKEEASIENANEDFEDTSELDSGDDLRQLSDKGVEIMEEAQ